MSKSDPTWSASALARHAGLPPSTVTYWVRSGLVNPIDPEESARGCVGYRIGISGLLELLAVRDLREAGFSVYAIRQVVKNLRKRSGRQRPLAELTILVYGNDIVWKGKDELPDAAASALREPGQRVMVFPVGKRMSALVDKIMKETVQDESN